MMIHTGAALLVGVAVGYLSGTLSRPRAVTAQSSVTTECPWPASLDAVAAAPRNHRVLLENEHVRVLDVTVAPGEREPLHAHCRPSVMYLIQEGVYRDYDAEGRLVEEAKVAPPPRSSP